MSEASNLPVLRVIADTTADGVTANITADGEELCSQRSSSLHWLRVDLTNRSSQVSKLLLGMYPDGYVLEFFVQRGDRTHSAGTEHIGPLPESARRLPQPAARSLTSTKTVKKYLRTFPFLIAGSLGNVSKMSGLLLHGASFDLVFGFVSKSNNGMRLWVRFPELIEDGLRAPTRVVTFGERGTHVMYASDEFSNPVDAHRKAEQLARKLMASIGQEKVEET